MKNSAILFLVFLGLSFYTKAQNEKYSEFVEYVGGDTISNNNGIVLYNADTLLKNKIPKSNQLDNKKFKPGYANKYKGKDFNYEEIKPRESFWSKLKRKINEWLRSILGTVDGNKTASYKDIALRILGIIVLGFVLYFIIKNLADKNGNWIFGKKNKKTVIRDEELHENIHEIDFPKSILHFESEKDYRSAIRYQFLYLLKRMSEKKLLNWNPEKTNKDYISELNNSPWNKEFQRFVYIFDYVWYGEFSIDEKQYQNFKNEFQKTNF